MQYQRRMSQQFCLSFIFSTYAKYTGEKTSCKHIASLNIYHISSITCNFKDSSETLFSVAMATKLIFFQAATHFYTVDQKWSNCEHYVDKLLQKAVSFYSLLQLDQFIQFLHSNLVSLFCYYQYVVTSINNHKRFLCCMLVR